MPHSQAAHRAGGERKKGYRDEKQLQVEAAIEGNIWRLYKLYTSGVLYHIKSFHTGRLKLEKVVSGSLVPIPEIGGQN